MGLLRRLFGDKKETRAEAQTGQPSVPGTADLEKKLALLDNAYLVRYNAELNEKIKNTLDSVLSAGEQGYQLAVRKLNEGLSFSGNTVSLHHWGEDTWNELLKKEAIIRAIGRSANSRAQHDLGKLLSAKCIYGQWSEIIVPALKDSLAQLRNEAKGTSA